MRKFPLVIIFILLLRLGLPGSEVSHCPDTNAQQEGEAQHYSGYLCPKTYTVPGRLGWMKAGEPW